MTFHKKTWPMLSNGISFAKAQVYTPELWRVHITVSSWLTSIISSSLYTSCRSWETGVGNAQSAISNETIQLALNATNIIINNSGTKSIYKGTHVVPVIKPSKNRFTTSHIILDKRLHHPSQLQNFPPGPGGILVTIAIPQAFILYNVRVTPLDP